MSHLPPLHPSSEKTDCKKNGNANDDQNRPNLDGQKVRVHATATPKPRYFHRVVKMGPFTLSTAPAVLGKHFRDNPGQSVIIVARPGDISGGHVVNTIRNRYGEVRFEIIEVRPQWDEARRTVPALTQGWHDSTTKHPTTDDGKP